MTNFPSPRHETTRFIWRKKIKKLDFLALATVVLWQPQYGRQFMLTQAFAKVRNHAGVNSDLPNFELDNGTNGQNSVAAVDLAAVTEGFVQRLAIIGNQPFDHDRPLRLRITDAPAGSTTLDVDLILVATEISELTS